MLLRNSPMAPVVTGDYLFVRIYVIGKSDKSFETKFACTKYTIGVYKIFQPVTMEMNFFWGL